VTQERSPSPEIDDALFLKRHIGGYRILRRIGEGGMGLVYEARHSSLGRRVAVKFLHPESSHKEELKKRLYYEARLMAQSRHKNVTDVQGIGALDGQFPYLMMEYLEGEPLSGLLERERRLPVHEAIPIFLQLLDGVGAVHRQGIVHRDLKPANLFLSPGKAGYVVKLLDFGVAERLGERPRRALTEDISGTPHYMAPEQGQGRDAEIDMRSDLYAVGVMLYETLCGVLPFFGPSVSSVLIGHITEAPPRPRTLNPALHPRLEEVILKALAKRREDRFQRTSEMAEALKPFGAGSRRPSAGDRAERPPASREQPQLTPLGAPWQGRAHRTVAGKRRSKPGQV
jgi:eukaryotic-like serine/threonine-protein kinase